MWPQPGEELERVMGIEPTRVAPSWTQKQSVTNADGAACDPRVTAGYPDESVRWLNDEPHAEGSADTRYGVEPGLSPRS
jgi:hypothetical protein